MSNYPLKKRARTLSSSSSVAQTQVRRRSNKAKKVAAYMRPERQLIPPSFRATLSYTEPVSISGNTGAVGTYSWRINDLYDPNLTGTGHQPLGFDQYMLLYNKFRVMNCTWELQLIGAVAPHCAVGVVCQNHQPTSLGPVGLWERDECQFRILSQYTTGQPTTVIRGSENMARLQGTTEAQYKGSDTNFGISSASPTELMTLTCQIVDASAGSNTVVVYGVVKLSYDTMFYDPIEPAQS